MNKEISQSIANKYGIQDLIDILSNKISGSELNSILLDVFNKRVQQESPSTLLSKYSYNKLVKPADIDIIKNKEEELDCYKMSTNSGFTPIELSPVAQFGSCSVIASVDQNKVLTALRNTEVQADPTNAIALHYALLRKKGRLDNLEYHFINLSRIIRTQVYSNPNFSPHFTSLCLASFGRDLGNFDFEKKALFKHLFNLYNVAKYIYKLNQIYFEIIPLKGFSKQSPLIKSCVEYSQNIDERLQISIAEPEKENNYYNGFRIKLKVIINSAIYEVGDGGLLDWTQRLLYNKKERMITSSIGTQLLHQLTK